ncbi:MAG TPA: hypothetical protein VGL66_06520 [Caulobacteraceae bacterium]
MACAKTFAAWAAAATAACALATAPAAAANHYPLAKVAAQTETLPAGSGLQLNPSTTSNPALNIPCTAGAAPTSPQDGDTWCTPAGLFVRVGGATVGPLGAGGGSSGLTISNFQWTDGSHYYTYPGGALNAVPSASAFSWVNQGSATETASAGQLLLADTSPSVSAVAWRLRVKTFSGKTTLVMAIYPLLQGGGAGSLSSGATGNNPCAGMILYESGTGKLLFFGADYDNTSNQGVGAWSFTSTTAFNAVRARVNTPQGTGIVWLKAVLSGGSTTLSYSLDGGVTYTQLYTAAATTNFTVAPNEWGYGVQSQQTATAPVINMPSSVALLSFGES